MVIASMIDRGIMSAFLHILPNADAKQDQTTDTKNQRDPFVQRGQPDRAGYPCGTGGVIDVGIVHLSLQRCDPRF